MNLNDPTIYKPIIFKRTNYYTIPATILRNVFMQYTKDGVKPNLGIQEIFLLTIEDYNKLMAQENPNFNRAKIREISQHSFTVKGYSKKRS